MRKLRFIIMLLILIILVIVIGIILINTNKGAEDMEVYEIQEERRIPLSKEENIGSYILSDELVKQFFIYVSERSDTINNNEAAYSLLDENYCKENNITKENIIDKFSNYKDIKSYSTKEMYRKRIDKLQESVNEMFYMKGVIRKNGKIYDVYVELREDLRNYTFDMSFLNKEDYEREIYNSNDDEEVFEIENREYNKLYTKTVEDYDACLKHMEDYKNALDNNIEEAYNLLDEEYREKRFGSLEKFSKYRQLKPETFGNENFTQYLVNQYDDYTEYVCKDAYGNLYVFTEEYPMEYTLKLDTYTIETDKFKNTYENGNDSVKVQMNINKFILMINNQDYESAYNVLDENFKKNYFDTEEKFIDYVKMYWYKYNDLQFNKLELKGNTYICNVNLTDLSNGLYVDESKGTGQSGYIISCNFVIQLKENHDFIIAFEVK